MKKRISVIIADDHPLLRKGVADLLREHGGFDLIGDANNGFELIELLEKEVPDVIILDVRMPLMDGSTALIKIKENYPDVHVIMISEYCDDDFIIVDFIEKGASFALSKKEAAETLVSVIASVMADEPSFPRDILKQLIRGDSKQRKKENLSEQEKDILLQFSKQKSIKEVAAHFFLSIATIKWHKANIYRKTKSVNEAGLVTYAFKRGWIY